VNQGEIGQAGAIETGDRSANRVAKAVGAIAVLAGIVVTGAALRAYELGRLSFWYDEVVTMRLARAGSFGQLIERLFQIDATRALLHPILLRAWLEAFGTSEASARSFSVVCGVATIFLIFLIGRIVFDTPSGLWAAWLGAMSPILVIYAREARMYALLVLVTGIAWLALLALLRARSVAWTAAYGMSLVALAYSHPLGLLMGATLAVAGLIAARTCFGGFARWILVHGVALLVILPWMKNYFDHPPEFVSGRPPIQFLLGVPIGFIGGDSRVLLALLLLIALGLWRRNRKSAAGSFENRAIGGWLAPAFLLLWLALPPIVLYLYSLMFYPIFGPARYTAFVAPVFVVLVAAGLRQLPALFRYPAAFLLALVSAVALGQLAYDPELKADWRDFGLAVTQTLRDHAGERIVVIVATNDPARNVEVETARYYLPDRCTVTAADDVGLERLDAGGATHVYFAVGLRHGRPIATVPNQLGGYQFHDEMRYPGLAVFHGTQ
jgi:hypothetical protein